MGWSKPLWTALFLLTVGVSANSEAGIGDNNPLRRTPSITPRSLEYKIPSPASLDRIDYSLEWLTETNPELDLSRYRSLIDHSSGNKQLDQAYSAIKDGTSVDFNAITDPEERMDAYCNSNYALGIEMSRLAEDDGTLKGLSSGLLLGAMLDDQQIALEGMLELVTNKQVSDYNLRSVTNELRKCQSRRIIWNLQLASILNAERTMPAHELAERAMIENLSIMPTNVSSQYTLSQTKFCQGAYEEGLANYYDMRGEDVQADVHREKSIGFYEDSIAQVDKSMEFLSQADYVDPKARSILEYKLTGVKANTYVKMYEFETAIELYDQMLESQHVDAITHYNLAFAHCMMGNQEKVLPHLSIAINGNDKVKGNPALAGIAGKPDEFDCMFGDNVETFQKLIQSNSE